MLRHACFVALLAGCGLSLDLSPPDPDRTDGGRFDGGRFDGGGFDGGRVDAATDGGDPDAGRCRLDLDCDDLLACNGIELCVDGTCTPGVPVVCPDDDVCDGTFECDDATGECTIEIEPLECEGGDACSGITTCDPRAGCITSPGLPCDDGIDCTDDRCEDGACVYVPRNDRCIAAGEGTCTAEGCLYEVCDEETCRPENPCQRARCEEDTCVRETIACEAGEECCGGSCAPIGCDDGNPCTNDACNPRRGCDNVPVTLPLACEDGDPCTTGDRCDGARCAPGGGSCTSSNVCLAPFCDPSTGDCGFGIVNGVPCSDGDPCTVNDRCSGGSCVGGASATCDDANACTVDSCGPSGCTHREVTDGTTCSAGPGLTGRCMGGRCFASTTCALGFEDCDGMPGCECRGTCATRMDGVRICTESACMGPCGRGETCCNLIDSREYGGCFGPETPCLEGACCVIDGI